MSLAGFHMTFTLGLKMGTVRSRIHRARAQLRAALDRTAGELSYVAGK